MFHPLATLALLANVLARAPHQRYQEQLQAVTYTNYYNVPSGIDGSTVRITYQDSEVTPRRNVNRNRYNDGVQEAVNGERRVHYHPEPVYTNANLPQYDINTKHIENDTVQGGLVLYDNINYDETPPFTNENKSKSDKTNTNPQVKSTDQGTRSKVTHVTESTETSQTSSRGDSQGKQSTRLNAITTEADVSLEDRVAFTGDQCPTGYAKVNGKCVEIQK